MNKFLLIDDEEVFNFIHTQVIQLIQPDAQIKEIRSSSMALDYIRTSIEKTDEFPDAILVDINMPEMNGFELLEELQKLSTSFIKKPHIYMVTSSLFESDRKRAQSFSILSGFMEKPISADQVQTVINQINSR